MTQVTAIPSIAMRKAVAERLQSLLTLQAVTMDGSTPAAVRLMPDGSMTITASDSDIRRSMRPIYHVLSHLFPQQTLPDYSTLARNYNPTKPVAINPESTLYGDLCSGCPILRLTPGNEQTLNILNERIIAETLNLEAKVERMMAVRLGGEDGQKARTHEQEETTKIARQYHATSSQVLALQKYFCTSIQQGFGDYTPLLGYYPANTSEHNQVSSKFSIDLRYPQGMSQEEAKERIYNIYGPIFGIERITYHGPHASDAHKIGFDIQGSASTLFQELAKHHPISTSVQVS